MIRFCSIASAPAVPNARVLAAALGRHHPGASLTVLVLDDAQAAPTQQGFEVVRLEDLDGFPVDLELGDQALADLGEVSKPLLMQLMLARDGTVAVFVEADVDVVGSLEPAIAPAQVGDVVLMPRLEEGIPDDGLEPTAGDLLDRGQTSSALVVAGGPEGRAFLSWWADNLIRTARSLDPPAPQPTNLVPCTPALARWLDVAPAALSSRPTMLDDPGFGVSYWNVHRRTLERRDSALLVGGSPLRCVQFSGFRPDRPYWLSEYATRPRVVDDAILSELCASYAGRLIGAGWVNPGRQAGGDRRLANGVPYDDRLRRLRRQAVASGEAIGDVFTDDGTRDFVTWLTAPAELGGHASVGRYLDDVYQEREDLRVAFPDLDGEDARKLIEWAWDFGRSELGLVPQLLPPRPVGPVGGTADQEIAVNVVGYLNRSLGLGQAARLYVSALQAAGVPVATVTAQLHLPVKESQEEALTRYGGQEFQQLQLSYAPQINLLCVNPDGLDGLLESAGNALEDARWTIGQWGWETDVLPAHWMPAFERVDELWVYSSYVAENLSRVSPVPVVTVPLPVIAPDPAAADLDFDADLDPGEGFTFLFVFDFFSTPQRKNPMGLVDAFTRAFAPGEGPRLVLKAMNGSFRPQAVDELRWRIGSRPDIHLIDKHVDQRTYAALIARCDCYVSLHRAEGFGLTLAEAMALGKPAIATGYSGNLEFMTARNSYLVDYQLARVGPDVEIYPSEGTWAEPDLDDAARLMREVWEHPDAARATGERGARDVAERLSPSKVGLLARARLEYLVTQPRAAQPASKSAMFEAVDRALAVDPERPAYGRHVGLAPLARRAVLRLIRPFAYHERELDRAIVEQLKRLGAEAARDRRARERDRSRLQELETRVAAIEEGDTERESDNRAATIRRDYGQRV